MPEITTASTIDNYSERDARLHITRLRDLLAGPYRPNPSAVGIDPAISFLTAVTDVIGKKGVKSRKTCKDDVD